MDNPYRVHITARRAGTDDYVPAEKLGLAVSISPNGANSSIMAVRNTGNRPFTGVIHVEMVFRGEKPAFYMPAFLYNRNRGHVPPYCNENGDHLPFPRLAAGSGLKGAADHWMVRADRLSHPVSMAVCGGYIFAVSGRPVSDRPQPWNGFTCRMGDGEHRIGFTLGYENAPWNYIFHTDLLPAERDISAGSVTLEPGETLHTEIEISCEEALDRQAVNRVIRRVYERFHQPVRSGTGLREAVDAIASAIYEDAYVPSMRTYSTRVFLQDGAVRQEELASISWTGGLEVAVPMLQAAIRLGREDLREQALTVIGYIVSHSLNEKSGLPFDAFHGDRWFTEGWWDFYLAQSGHSSYLVGQALYYILKACELEKLRHPDWLDWARSILDRIETTKNADGEVPYLWSAEDGRALDYDSMGGVWCVAAAAYYDKLLQTDRYQAGCEKSLRHYYNAYVRNMECYGTPLDTQKAVDSEGILPFVKACRMLHEQSGDERWLKLLADGLEYEFTFKFCWNPPIEADPLKRIGWSACGGSVTSTCNPHIHPMSNNIADEILYCYERSGDLYWKHRLEDTTRWALQTYSTYDGEYDYGKKGWMSERFCYSEALLLERYPDGSPCSTWKCFLPWGTSNLLEGLCGRVWDII